MENEEKYSLFIEEVNAFSGGKLKHKGILLSMIAITDSDNKLNEFLEIIFFAKFVAKLYNILKKSTPGQDAFEKIKEEFSSHIAKVKEMILNFARCDPALYAVINENCFSNSTGSFGVFMELLDDLSWIKNRQIDNKKLW